MSGSKNLQNTAVVWHHATVTRERREQLNGHRGVVLWFTGLPSSGKSTIAHAVEERLHQLGCRTSSAAEPSSWMATTSATA